MNVNSILDIMGHYHLTADEVLLVWISLAARDEEGHPEYFNKWYNNGGKDRLKPLFNSLKEKGCIHKDYNPASYNPNDIEWSQTFLKGWWKYSLALGQELLDTYPSFININGKLSPLKDITKSKCTSLDEFFFFYASQIGHSVQKHKEIIELIKWGKQNSFVFGNIASFVGAHLWNSIREMRDNPDIIHTVANITRDE